MTHMLLQDVLVLRRKRAEASVLYPWLTHTQFSFAERDAALSCESQRQR